LQQIFDTLINSFIESKVGIAEHFLSDRLAGHLKDNLNTLYEGNNMLAAGTGNKELVLKDKLVRSDVIHWLDRKHNNPYENEFFDLMDAFVLHLNNECYTGITGYEFHYTLYEEGSFYKKHLDQFRNNESRQFSMIMYLNVNWVEKDGGQLSITRVEGDQQITPVNGKTVFFRSNEMEHEVLVTNKPRLSITGWLKRD
jgi:SM-20-related protein